MFKRLLTCLAVVAAVSAAGNVCKVGKAINKPVINGTPVFWPASWNETQPAPQLEKGQSCSWIVTIPRGYYAKLIISGKTTGNDSVIQTVDSAGNRIQTTQENMEPYYFPASKFTIAVTNKGFATLAFKVVWWPLPPSKYVHLVGPTGQVVNVTETIFAMQYEGPGGLTLLTFPGDLKNYYSLRSALVFEGNNLDTANYVSNLYLLYQKKVQWSTSQEILAGIDEIVELHPQSMSDLELQMIDAQMEDDSTVSVYYGSPEIFALDKTYTKGQLENALPLSFNGSFVQFVVSSAVSRGKAVFTFKS
nr:hypothetical protein F55G11.3 - Caenorhabditis elegans [Caenorhabditis elegans]